MKYKLFLDHPFQGYRMRFAGASVPEVVTKAAEFLEEKCNGADVDETILQCFHDDACRFPAWNKEFSNWHELLVYRDQVQGNIENEAKPSLKFRIVQKNVGVVEGDIADLMTEAQMRGYTPSGFNNNPQQRKELQGHPRFAELLGPMWDGDAIRYECQATYDLLSQ